MSRVSLSVKVIFKILSGGHVKYGSYLHQLLFEVIARNKTRYPVQADAMFSYQIDKMQILMQNVHDTKFC